jgi:hypothetical protein
MGSRAVELRQLARRWRIAYAKLSITVEASAGQAPHDKVIIARPKSEGSPPKGSGNLAAVAVARSDMERWARRFKADPEGHDPGFVILRALCAEVECAVEEMRGADLARVPEREVRRDSRVLKDYEGVHYADAAVMEGPSCSRSWIRTLRQRNGRDPLYGRRLVRERSKS